MARYPSYLQLVPNGTFHFRIAIPKDLRLQFNKREIKRTLKTSNRNLAMIMAQQLFIEYNQKFSEARMTQKKSPYPDTGIITSRLTKFPDGTERKEVIVEGKTPQEEVETQQALVERGIFDALSGSPEALNEALKAAEENILSLSELIAEYTKEKDYEKAWTSETQYEFAGIFQRFKDIIGDIPVGEIGFDQARHYKNILMQLPPHMNKLSKYKGMSIEQIIASKPAKTLGVATINKHIGTISSLFDWARRNRYVTENFFAGLSMRQKKGSKSKYKPFTADDLNRLFSTDIYTAGKYNHPYQYWVPVIALFTGARLEEICRLRLIDFQVVDDIPVFNITEEGESRLKNESSSRIVPIHSELIRLGLLRYVAYLDKKNRKIEQKRLFPELTPHEKTGKFNRKAGRWFNDTYRPARGVTAPGKVFHSFRHTVNNQLKQNRSIDRAFIKAIMGHKSDDMTDHYGSSYGPAVLQPVVETLAFELPPIQPYK